MSYNYNRFKSTSVFGKFENLDLDASNNAVATFQRNINVGGDVSCNNVLCNDISCNDLYLNRGLTTSSLTESIFNHIVQFNSYIKVAGAGFLVGAITISPQEFGYLDGVTSNIQNQINNISSPTDLSLNTLSVSGNTNLYSTYVNGNFQVSNGFGSKFYSQSTFYDNILLGNASTTTTTTSIYNQATCYNTLTMSSTSTLNLLGTISANSQTISPSELSYLNGATSRIQTQMNNNLGVSNGVISLQSTSNLATINFLNSLAVNIGSISTDATTNKMIFNSPYGFDFSGNIDTLTTTNGTIITLNSTTANLTTINATNIFANTFLATINGATDYKCSGSIQLKDVSSFLPKIQFYASDALGGGITSEIYYSPTLSAFRLETSLSNGFQFNNNISTTGDITANGSIKLRNTNIVPQIQFFDTDSANLLNGRIYTSKAFGMMRFEITGLSTFLFTGGNVIVDGLSTAGTATIAVGNMGLINSNVINVTTTLKSSGILEIKNVGTTPEINFFTCDNATELNGRIYTNQSTERMRFDVLNTVTGFEFSGGIVYVSGLSTSGTASIETGDITTINSTTTNATTVNSTTINATTLKASGSVQVRNVGTVPELQFFNTNAGNVLNGKIYTSQSLNFMRFDVTGLGGFEFTGGTVYVPGLSTTGTASIGTGNITTINSTTTNATTLKATGSVQIRNVGTIPELIFYNTDATNAINGKIYTSQATTTMRFDCLSSVGTFEFNGGSVRLGQGFRGKQGQNGATFGNIMNRYWTGSALQAWVDTTNIGNFTICDYRIKENIQPPSNVLDRLCNVPMFCYELKDIGIFKKKGTHIGFYAHELEEAFPELNNIVDGEKDDITDEGEIQPQTVTSEFCNVLMRCIQEQNILIKSLTQRVTELEQKLISL